MFLPSLQSPLKLRGTPLIKAIKAPVKASIMKKDSATMPKSQYESTTMDMAKSSTLTITPPALYQKNGTLDGSVSSGSVMIHCPPVP